MRDGIERRRCCLCVNEVILVRNWKLLNVLVNVSVRAFDGTVLLDKDYHSKKFVLIVHIANKAS
jgi:hypothetical protein